LIPLFDAGTKKSLNPKDLVVGDVLVIKGGDQCFADSVLFGNKML
jgi:magnesium-transporting ATPase (P-type)